MRRTVFSLCTLVGLACTPPAPAVDHDAGVRPAPVDDTLAAPTDVPRGGGDVVTVSAGPDAGPTLDAGVSRIADAGPGRLQAASSLAPVRVPVEPPSMADHPVALALKAIFNDDDHVRDQAERDVLSPQLRARYKRINTFCGALLKRQSAFDYTRNDRDDELWGLCDWDRMTCGNGDPGAHRVIIEQHDEKTAKAIVVKFGERRVPVRLAMLDRWRVIEIDCGRDTILTTSGLLNEDVAEAGTLDAGTP